MQTPSTLSPSRYSSDVINQLRSFCRGELAAVDTYKRAIASSLFPGLADAFERCLASHERRVALLRDKIRELGGTAPESAGAWGALVRLLGGAASAISEKAMISVLEEGEGHGVRDYRGDMSKLDPASHLFIAERILPEQIETHDTMVTLKEMFHE